MQEGMLIEVKPKGVEQRPPEANQIRVINNNQQGGEYEILPDGMSIECPAEYDETQDLMSNAEEFFNKGNVSLNIEWL